VVSGDEQKRVRLTEGATQVERDAATWWVDSGRQSSEYENPLKTIPSNPARDGIQTAKITGSDGGSIDVAARKITRFNGVDWDIVVAVPRSDFTAPIVRSAALMFGVVVTALIAALQLGLWIVRRVTRDVDRLVASVEAYSLDNIEPPQTETTLRETTALSQAFRGMFERLRDSLGTIRRQNEELAAFNASLEARVEQRTVQIEQKNAALTTEIVRREALEKELRLASESAIKAASDKARFLAMLSHELRTPLQSVLGTSALLSQKLPEQSEDLRVLDASAKSVLTLIDGILSYARLEAGKVAPHRVNFRVRDVVEESVLLATAAKAGGGQRTDVSVNVAPNVPQTIWSDAGILCQLIVNLVANAHKHAPDSDIAIGVRCGDPNARLDDHDESFLLHVSVADNGAGIAASERARLFTPFGQLERKGEAEKSGSSGLGLAICALLVRTLGGDIRLNEERTHGTEIEFWIRVAPERAKEAVADKLSVAADESTNTLDPALLVADRGGRALHAVTLEILLVEDHPINLRLVSQMLSLLGHRVVTAASGEAALEVFREEMATADRRTRFDVVLTDLNLPGISGFEVAREILRICTARSVDAPMLVALTASAETSSAAMERDAGLSKRVTKPATLASLENALAESVQRKRIHGSEPTPK
jgi:signal transduction histidine kinase/ActR/RegA family two-component response regulator